MSQGEEGGEGRTLAGMSPAWQLRTHEERLMNWRPLEDRAAEEGALDATCFFGFPKVCQEEGSGTSLAELRGSQKQGYSGALTVAGFPSFRCLSLLEGEAFLLPDLL